MQKAALPIECYIVRCVTTRGMLHPLPLIHPSAFGRRSHGSQVEAVCGAVIFRLHGVQMNTENLAQQVVIFDLVVVVCTKY
jgi:hypothetical protein